MIFDQVLKQQTPYGLHERIKQYCHMVRLVKPLLLLQVCSFMLSIQRLNQQVAHAPCFARILGSRRPQDPPVVQMQCGACQINLTGPPVLH